MLMVVAPSSITASSTRHRKSMSLNGSRLRAELDIGTQVARKAHRQLGLLEHLLGVMRSFFSMCSALVAMKVWMRARVGALQRLGRARDVAVVGARQRAHGGVLDVVGDGLHGLEVAVARAGREAGLDDVHLQPLELARDAQLLVAVIDAPGDCSPSRKVVSKMISLSVMVVLLDRRGAHGGMRPKKTARCGRIRAVGRKKGRYEFPIRASPQGKGSSSSSSAGRAKKSVAAMYHARSPCRPRSSGSSVEVLITLAGLPLALRQP
jgi:hypothetical protein